MYYVLIEKQGGSRGSTSTPNIRPQNVPVTHEAGPSQPLTPANPVPEVYSDSRDEEGKGEDMVSFNDIMDAADHVADAFEVSHMSRVSALEAHKRRRHLARILELVRCRTTVMTPESSDTKYSSESQGSVTIDGPMWEDTCQCQCSSIQGRQEVVIIHLSSDSEEDVDID